MKRVNKRTCALFINLIKVLCLFLYHNALNKHPGHLLILYEKRGWGGGRLMEGCIYLKNSISAKHFVFLSD